MIGIEHVYFGYEGTKYVLRDINMTIENGQFVGIIGRNGAGKSTLLKIILHLLKPQSGVVYDDFKKSSFLSQVTGNLDLSFPASVKEIVSLGLKWKPFQFMNKADWEKAYEAMRTMGIYDLRNRAVSSLSGGQQQRVRLAKALVGQPDLLVLDEPTTGMDVSSRDAFLEEVNKLHRERGMTIVLVTHFYDDLSGSDEVYELNEETLRPKELKAYDK